MVSVLFVFGISAILLTRTEDQASIKT